MASSYGYIKKGAQGDTVKWLQQQLGINADGVFGSQTEQAVRDFQRQNGIQVDGIVGNETMEYLLGQSTPTQSTATNWGNPNTNSTANWLADYGPRPTYSPSQATTDAANLLAQYEANKPGAYQSNYAAQIQDMLDQIMNREKFSYDFNADPLYQQMSQKYQQQGKMAMMDAMGNAAALTGGYGSSYGQQVGQQAYQQHLQNLNDVIPELRDAAYQMYADEGNRMLQQMDLLRGLDDTDYGRYRDDVSDYYNMLDYYSNKYRDSRDFDFGKYNTDLAAWQDDRAFGYNAQQDALAQQNWEREFALAQDQWNKEYALAQQKASSGGSGGGSGTDGGDKDEPMSISESISELNKIKEWYGPSVAADAFRYMQQNNLITGTTAEINEMKKRLRF